MTDDTFTARSGAVHLARIIALLIVCGMTLAQAEEPRRPTLFLVGDSTVKNGTPGQVGWGTAISGYFDSAKVRVQNRALGGRSSRSYFREGLWDAVCADLKPGDFVLIQFGHNDNGPIDEGKARASLKGNGDETQDVTIKETGAKETVHTYGWYVRHFVNEAKSKGAIPIVCSLIARNIWENGKVVRAADSYAKWAREAATATGALFIDLNEITACRYEAAGEKKVSEQFFTTADHTHTNQAGAEINAACVARAIRSLQNCPLASCLLPSEAIPVEAE
jgi:lysophospholipase L1-like esterase